MNKKKLLQKIAAAAVCTTMLTGVLSVTACQTEPENPPAGHQHNYTWVDDENGTTHHEHCGVDGCDAPDKASENHVDSDNNNVCDKCGADLSGEEDDGEYDLVSTAVNFDEAARDIDPSASGNFVLPENYNYKNKVLFTASGKSRFEVGSNRFNTQGEAGTIIITLSGKTNSLKIAGKGASDKFTGYKLSNGGTDVKAETLSGQVDFSFELTDLPAGTYTLVTLGGAARINKIELTEKLAKSEATSISVTASKVDFLVNEDFSSNGLSVILNYANGRKDALTASDYEITQSIDKNTAGKYTVNVKYKNNPDFTDTYDVYYYTVDSIKMHTIGYSGSAQVTLQQAAVTGGTLSNNYLTVQGTGTVEGHTATFNLPADALDITNVSTATAGEKQVNVSVKSNYATGGKTLSDSYNVMVKNAVTAVDNKVEITVGETGDFKTLTQAVQFLKACNLAENVNKVIKLQAGTYTEKVWIDIPNLTVIGLGTDKDDTVITYSLVEGDADAINGLLWGLSCATVHVTGKNFKAYNLAIRNDFDYMADSGKYSGNQAAQGLALTLEGDGNVIYNCHLFGNQDTLYMKSGRTYYYQTQIDGNIDFIFGGEKGLAFFEECKIVAIDREGKTSDNPQNGYVTAPQHKTATKPDYGYIFYKCELTDDGNVNAGSMALGRPWGPAATVAYIECSFSAAYSTEASDGSHKIHRWNDMSGNLPENADYIEYGSTGAGAITTSVKGGSVIDATQAANYTKENIFGNSNGKSGYTTVFDCDTAYSNLRILAGLDEGDIAEDPTEEYDFTTVDKNSTETVQEHFDGKLEWTGTGRWNGNSIQVNSDTVIKLTQAGKVSINWYSGYGTDSDAEITYDAEGKATIKIITAGRYIEKIILNKEDVPSESVNRTVSIYVQGEGDPVLLGTIIKPDGNYIKETDITSLITAENYPGKLLDKVYASDKTTEYTYSPITGDTDIYVTLKDSNKIYQVGENINLKVATTPAIAGVTITGNIQANTNSLKVNEGTVIRISAEQGTTAQINWYNYANANDSNATIEYDSTTGEIVITIKASETGAPNGSIYIESIDIVAA